MRTKYYFFCLILSVFIVKPVFSQSAFYDINSVKEVRIYFKESNWKSLLDSLFIHFGDNAHLQGDVKINGTLLRNIGVRYKGYSSWDPSQIKTPFNITLDYTIKGQNYQGITKLKLGNVVGDPTFVREAISYEVARKYMPAPFSNYANVYVNDTLLGLYSNVESVDDNFLDQRFKGSGNTFFKGAPETLNLNGENNADLAYHGADTSSYKPYYELESANSETSWLDLVRFINILNNDTADLDTILNIDRALWMHALNYSLVNLDSYIGYSQNYYIYMDDNGRFGTIPWDFNLSFGSFRETDGINFSISIAAAKSLNPLGMISFSHNQLRPLIVNLIEGPTYKRMYLAHIRTIINENFKNDLYYLRGQEIQNTIDSAVQNDPNNFFSYANFLKNLDTTAVISSQNKIVGIKELMRARINYLDTFPGISGSPVISNILSDSFPEQGSQTWITANVTGANEVFLGYRFKSNGVFKRIYMYDDGNHHDGNTGDGIYGASVIISGATIQYYIYAQNDSAGIFSPERAEYEYYSIQPKIKQHDIVFNEIMTKNINSATDQNGEHDAWIELYNTTSENLSLKNLLLFDGNMSLWAFPDTTIQANSYLIVWADNDLSQNGLHTIYTLPLDSGQFYISYGGNKSIDSIKYGLQTADKSYGRYPNGYGAFVYMLPTFARMNNIGTTPASDFLLYPNPASDYIYIEMSEPGNFYSYVIYNSTGQKVISGDFNYHSSDLSSALHRIDITKWDKGIYILKASAKNNFVTKKFMINN